MNLPDTTAALQHRAAASRAWARVRIRLKRSLAFMTVLCVAIALLLTAMDRGGLGVMLVYSFSIGMSCWFITDGLRLAVAWGVDTARIRRGAVSAAVGFDLHWRGVLPLLLLGMLIGPLVGLAIADAITGNRSPGLWQLGSQWSRVTIAITVIATLMSMFVLTTLERLAAARAEAEAARRVAAENQLKLLESQLEPHMLFNTLANLRVLIGLDPLRAQAMLDRLIAFLRATLNASRTGAHPLAAEFERIGDYLALMAVRMGPRLRFTLDLPAELRDQPVPPLLLQPLVENSIKHGLEPKIEGGHIAVRARRLGLTLELTVHDTGVGLGSTSQPGSTNFGLQQVRSRLHTLYGQAASFSLTAAAEGAGTIARIALPTTGPMT